MAGKPKGPKYLVKKAFTEEQRREKLAQMGVTSYRSFMDVRPEFEKYVAMGLSEANACHLAGIHPQTIEKHKQSYPEYKEKLAMLKQDLPGKVKLRHAELLKTGGDLSPKDYLHALEWYLERNPDTKNQYTKTAHVLSESVNREVDHDTKAKIMEVFEAEIVETDEETSDTNLPAVV